MEGNVAEADGEVALAVKEAEGQRGLLISIHFPRAILLVVPAIVPPGLNYLVSLVVSRALPHRCPFHLEII